MFCLVAVFEMLVVYGGICVVMWCFFDRAMTLSWPSAYHTAAIYDPAGEFKSAARLWKASGFP
jgi:hypothetical protein